MTDRVSRHKRIFPCLLLAGALCSCTGAIEETAGGGEDNSQSDGKRATTGTGPNKQGPPGAYVPSPDTGLWRLTRTEYLISVRQLLQGTDISQVSNLMGPDPSFASGIFDNNAQVLKADTETIDRYDVVGGLLVESAFRPGSASRAKLVSCDLAAAGCARSVVSAFARRAWRRKVDNLEVDELMKALDLASAQGDSVEEGVKVAFRMMLVSPNFLYRVEIDPPNTTGIHPVSPHELATRLSYFVWSSTPDDILLDRADDGTLGKPDVLAAELARMLADTRASALSDNFAMQWLGSATVNGAVRRIADVFPDTKKFPQFDEPLRKAMAGESQAFFRAFLNGDRNVVDMLDTDFTFANDRLAKHYNLPALAGTQMRQVPADGQQRFGLLTQGGFLTLTSNPGRTSPVQRGKWVLSRLLCSPPGNPPPDVGTFPEDPTKAGLPANASLRDRLRVHMKEPRCVACHAAMDPVGLALEHYTAIGQWREHYAGNTANIDVTGEAAGMKFDGAKELSQRLKENPAFLSCIAGNVFEYALGRSPSERGDQVAVDALAFDLAQKGGRIRDLISLVSSSKAFQNRGWQP